MSKTKEKLHDKIEIGMRKQSLFSKFCFKLQTVFLFFIPPYFKKKKKYVDVSKQQGLPFIVCVENNTSKQIHNVELFGSYNMLGRDVFDRDGNYVIRGLKISSGIPNVSYRDILNDISFLKFKVGLTYISTVNQKQIFHPLKVIKKAICGDLTEKVITITKDPYQQQKNIVAVKNSYEIDGLTTIVIPTVEAKTTALYYFYPEPLYCSKIKKENIAFRFFKSISNYFKKKEVVKVASLPFTIEVCNTTDEVKKNVCLFGSYVNIAQNDNKYFNKYNDLVANDVLISSLTPNISYREILNHLSKCKTTIGLNYIRSINGNLSQITSEYRILNKDAKGNSAERKILPIIDAYQQQSDVVTSHQKFIIDGFTEFIISELQPKTTVVYQFYPEEEIVKK